MPNVHSQPSPCSGQLLPNGVPLCERSGGGMSSITIVEATDPDLFVESGRPAKIDLTVTERGVFWARRLGVDFGHLRFQQTRERLASVKHLEVSGGGILFLTEPGPSMFMNGAEVGMDQIVVARPGACYSYRLSGAAQWGSIVLPAEDADDLFRASRLGSSTVLTPPPDALARVRSRHGHLSRVAETTPEVLSNTEFVRNQERQLLAAMWEAVGSQVSGLETIGRYHHQIIVARFCRILEALEAQADQTPDMSEISRRIGVSGRLLRLACQEQLGVSPTQYAILRRMQAVRRVLQNADPKVNRVTDIAIEHGFWELGRFAVKYRHIFGETPSATLKRAA
jgi:AraC-like DNA-binding protein